MWKCDSVESGDYEAVGRARGCESKPAGRAGLGLVRMSDFISISKVQNGQRVIKTLFQAEYVKRRREWGGFLQLYLSYEAGLVSS